MVLKTFLVFIWLLFGARGGLLGALWGPQIYQKGLTHIDPSRFGALSGIFCSLLTAEDVIETVSGAFWGCF